MQNMEPDLEYLGTSRQSLANNDGKPDRPPLENSNGPQLALERDQEPHQASQLDWLLIGGGIHGVHLSARMIGEAGVSPERLLIIDPADQLLSRWRRCTATTGMTYLRSPGVHHVGLNPYALERFAGKRRRRAPGLFAGPYRRPKLELFNAHCDSVIEELGLSDRHIKARAVRCAVESDGIVVYLSNGREVFARRIVLALGSQEPNWPSWAPREHALVDHIFQPDFDATSLASASTVAVVGGGISAAQVALRLRREGHSVHLVSRHPLRTHQFDSAPGWLGPKLMTGFHREPCLVARRTMIHEARYRGSVPPATRAHLRAAIEQGAVGWHQASVESFGASTDVVSLSLSDGTCLGVDHLLLATGTSQERPGGALLDELINTANLPLAGCGFPVVDRALRWHPRIHVSGALAELELGPTSRNIAGARRAGDRLVRCAWAEAAPDRRSISLSLENASPPFAQTEYTEHGI